LLRQEFDPVAEEEYAQKAATLDPKLPGAHLMLGELYLYKSRVSRGDRAVPEGINSESLPAQLRITKLGRRPTLESRKYDDAERLLQRSIWLDATSTGPYILMGKVLEEKRASFELAVAGAAPRGCYGSEQFHHTSFAGTDVPRHGPEGRGPRTELKTAEELQNKQGFTSVSTVVVPKLAGGAPGVPARPDGRDARLSITRSLHRMNQPRGHGARDSTLSFGRACSKLEKGAHWSSRSRRHSPDIRRSPGIPKRAGDYVVFFPGWCRRA